MIFIYTTARGLVRTVEAEHAHDAWKLAAKRHKPWLLLNLTGEAWGESARGGAIRDRFGDVTTEHARTLLFRAIDAEIPVAREEMVRAAEGKWIAPGLQRLLAPLGLIAHDGPDFVVTDLGRAFVAWAKDGAS